MTYDYKKDSRKNERNTEDIKQREVLQNDPIQDALAAQFSSYTICYLLNYLIKDFTSTFPANSSIFTAHTFTQSTPALSSSTLPPVHAMPPV